MNDRLEGQAATANDICAVLGATIAVVEADAVVAGTRAEDRIALLRIVMGFPVDSFEGIVRPVIGACASYVQQLPAVGSMRHGGAGGRFVHALEWALRALHLRRSYALPPGVPPEVLGEHLHRWTYAVFVASVLTSASQAADGLRIVRIAGESEIGVWYPSVNLDGMAGGTAYRARLAPDCIDPDRAVVTRELYMRWVPSVARSWMGEDERLVVELDAWFAGTREDGLLGEVIRRAGGTFPGKAVGPGGLGSGVSADPDEASTEETGAESGAGVPGNPGCRRADTPSAGDGHSGVAASFLRWLASGIEGRSLEVNTASAMVHRVAEGLLLVSPRVFRAFVVRQSDGTSHMGATAESAAVKEVQRSLVQESPYVADDHGGSLLTYQYRDPMRLGVRLFGVVIREPERWIATALPINDGLVRVSVRPRQR